MSISRPTRCKLLSALILPLLLAWSGTAWPLENLDPFEAEFFVLPDSQGRWSDVRVTLQFKIHNQEQGSLLGSKFVCSQAIESVSVTDAEGRRLPFTIKEYPRKRIMWEYGPARQGGRRVKISFVIKNAIEHRKEGAVIHIDWIGGWKRRVMNTTLSVVLPGMVKKGDVVSAYPAQYALNQTEQFSKIQYSFPEIKIDTLKLVVKAPGPEPLPDVAAKPGPKPLARTRALKNIRLAPYNRKTDRLVFDLSRTTEFKVDKKKNIVEIRWKQPLEIEEKAQKKKNIRSRRVAGLTWKKGADKRWSCLVKLKKKSSRIRYGSLPAPSRVYLDVLDALDAPPPAGEEKKPVQKLVQKKVPPPSQPPSPAKPKIEEKDIQPPPARRKPELSLEKEAPIQEKLSYMKARKLFKLGEYLSAVKAYEIFLEKYPKSVLREDATYDIADCYFSLADTQNPKYHDSAIESYKRASANFPMSHRAAQAAFRIAESYRKNKFFIEARSQYVVVVEKFSKHPEGVDARFWIAECLYQMQRFEEALKLFELFVSEYQNSTHLKKASFRIADCYVQIKDFDRAEYYYEKAIQRWPDLAALPAKGLNNLAVTYYYKGKFEKCRRAFLLSFNIYPDQENRDRLLRFIGDSYQWEGKMQSAMNVYGSLCRMFPGTREHMIALMRLADLGINVAGLESDKHQFKGFNPYREPEQAYRWVIQNDQEGGLLAEAHYKLGFTLAKEGDYGGAVSAFKKSMYQKEEGLYYQKSFSNVQDILVKMIAAAADRGAYFPIVDLYKKNEQVFLKHIDDSRFLYNVGIGYLETGFLNSAEKTFNRMLAKPEKSDLQHRAIICLARIDLARYEAERAQERLSILLYGQKISPDLTVEASHVLGDAFYAGGKYQEAVESYSAAVKNQAISFRAAKSLLNLGESFGKIGYYYNGIQAFSRLLKVADQVQPRREELMMFKDEARLMMGDFFAMKKNYKAAVEVYSTLAQDASGKQLQGWAHVKWGETLAKTGDTEGAKSAFSQVSDLMPYDFLGVFAQERLKTLKWEGEQQPDLKQFM